MHLLSLHNISFLGWLYQIHTAFQTLPHQLLLLRNTRRLKMEIQAAHAPPISLSYWMAYTFSKVDKYFRNIYVGSLSWQFYVSRTNKPIFQICIEQICEALPQHPASVCCWLSNVLNFKWLKWIKLVTFIVSHHIREHIIRVYFQIICVTNQLNLQEINNFIHRFK